MATTTVSVRPATINADPRIVVYSPYHPDFAPRAKLLGGKFAKSQSGPYWHFDPRDEARVRDLCREIYGTDGSDPAGDLVTIRATLNYLYRDDPALYIAGRQVARVLGRDSGARLAEGVVLVSGRLSSGGSARYYHLTAQRGTVIEIRDLPRAAVEREIRTTCAQCEGSGQAFGHACGACGGSGLPPTTIEIIEDAETPEDVARRMGTGAANSPVEQVWAAIQALPIEEQVEIRNRLLAAL
jgi:hypothetical protein